MNSHLTAERSPLSCDTIRSLYNRLRRRAREKRVQAETALCRRANQCSEAEQNALRLHRAWAELALKAPPIAMALDLYHYENLTPQGVAVAMGRSMRTGMFYLRFGEAALARSLRR